MKLQQTYMVPVFFTIVGDIDEEKEKIIKILLASNVEHALKKYEDNNDSSIDYFKSDTESIIEDVTIDEVYIDNTILQCVTKVD